MVNSPHSVRPLVLVGAFALRDRRSCGTQCASDHAVSSGGPRRSKCGSPGPSGEGIMGPGVGPNRSAPADGGTALHREEIRRLPIP